MPNHYLPYGCQNITESDIAAVVNVLRGPMITQGSYVPEFERAFSAKTSSQYAVAVNSATSALHLACLALGLGPGDWLWTSPISFVASANCGLYCGASVDFVDINPSTGLICLKSLQKKLIQAERLGRLPKVLVPVHLTGSSCDMESIGALANRYGFTVLEDASHAVGGSYKSAPVGNCKYSHICVFSFHPVKIITTGEGGIATTNSPELAQRMRDLRSHGITKDKNRFKCRVEGPWSYEQQELGFNYRMTDFQAALGNNQLQRLESIVFQRNQLFKHYQTLLDLLPLRLLDIPDEVASSVHLAVIRLDNPEAKHHREVFESLRKEGFGVQLHYTPIHLQPYYRKFGFVESDFPEAEAYAINAISLPLYPGLSKQQQLRVAKSLANLLTK